MRIRFWGTRGSLAKPGPTTIRYGGNTSCVEVVAPDGTLIVLDCGTGAHELGQSLVANGRPVRGHLLITHTHWDHIQGFPFFEPLLVAGNEWDVYAPQGPGQHLQTTLAGQMEYSYFPVTLGQLAATIRYHELTEGSFRLGSVMVHARYLNHPGLTLGYRLEANGVTMVYATDHEPHSPHHPEAAGSGAEAPLPVHREDQGHVEFLAGADLVVHDAQYTLDEYPEKRTWGHSPAERAVDFALAARVKRLALFHHDPGRSDDDMDRLLAACRQRAEGSGLDVFAAVEGQVVELAAGNTAAPPVLLRRDARLAAAASAKPAATTILLVDDDPEILDVLVLTFEAEGYRVLSTDNGDTALELARAERPDLLILDWRLPGRDGLSVCRALRADPDPQLREVPVVLVTGQSGAEDTAAGFAAGVTDYVTKPFKPSHLRARVHAWLLRRRSGGGESG